jgi:predicted AlkP superfamily pyrophosphatase or phosphodiesterase
VKRSNPRRTLRIAIQLLLFLTAACHGPARTPAPAAHPRYSPRTVIVLGVDGFARRYFDADSAPALHALARTGVIADAMIPSFPSFTFPNFYTLATGLYPDHTGIVNNNFIDPAHDSMFSYKRPIAREGYWWGGEPIWVTAQKHGVRSATMFWVGSEAPVQGVRPWSWSLYDHALPFAARVDRMLSWLDRAPADRPRLIMGYFEQPDMSGHEHGPDSPETRAAVLGVDSAVSRLIAGLSSRQLYDSVDIIIVADHGMAAVDTSRVVYLDDVVDSANVRVVNLSPLLLIAARDGNQRALLARLRTLPHVTAWLKERVPARMHYGTNVRITPIVGVADVGWTIAWRHGATLTGGGAHGYDNASAEMQAIFLAHGPDFRPGRTIGAFPNVDLYDLLARLLGIDPAPNDGSIAPFEPVLRQALTRPRR